MFLPASRSDPIPRTRITKFGAGRDLCCHGVWPQRHTNPLGSPIRDKKLLLAGAPPPGGVREGCWAPVLSGACLPRTTPPPPSPSLPSLPSGATGNTRLLLPHDRPLNPCRQCSCPLPVFSRHSRPGLSNPSSDDIRGFKSP